MHDPVADMLTRIRNGQQAKHQTISMMSSNLKEQIAKVLKEEGYIKDYRTAELSGNKRELSIELKYYQGLGVIERIKRISRPGLRIYKNVKSLDAVPGFGIAILSTSQGVMTHITARKLGVGGELMCEVA